MRSEVHLSRFGYAMTANQFWALALVTSSVAACHGDAVTSSPVIPLAAIHFVNAVPDTAKMDFRVVDIVSNASLFGAAFRDANMFYRGIEAGTRRIRVFYDTTDVVVAQTVLSDTELTYVANQSYTFVEAGFARTGSAPARTVWSIADNAGDPGAGNVGLRVVHAGAGVLNVDAYAIRHPGDTLALTVRVGTNLAFGAVGGYVTIAADTQSQATRVVFTLTGTTTPILANIAVPTGTAGTSTTNPIAGATVPGSVLTAILVPPSVPGSKAPAFAAAGATILVDRRPPNTAPTGP